ncbi:MAG TPA: hypothetical protein VKB62_08205 [Streptosporangiaceae bacterium]|nr:hypothetical protein [Streptosporangiaceae bacterium]
MSRIWRWITPVAVAGGLAIGIPAIPAATASTAATSITINATSPHYPRLKAKDHGKVDGHAIVIYKATTNSENTGVVSGTVTTTATNDEATLLAEPFGASRYTKVAGPVALSATGGYSFNVKPSLATHYKVKLSGPDAGVVSGVVTVYVTEGGRIANIHARRSGNSIRFSFRLYIVLPKSALRHEIGKHWYEYLAVGYPRLPRFAPLARGATVSRARKVTSGEYFRTFSYSFRLRHSNPNPDPIECVKDTESKDGMGLPGHHGCGAKRVRSHVLYLG